MAVIDTKTIQFIRIVRVKITPLIQNVGVKTMSRRRVFHLQWEWKGRDNDGWRLTLFTQIKFPMTEHDSNAGNQGGNPPPKKGEFQREPRF